MGRRSRVIKCWAKAGLVMEYLYIAMLLQELGKGINEENIQKIFSAMDMEIDDAKVRLLISALSILTTANLKEVKSENEALMNKQLSDFQKRFILLEDSTKKAHEKLEELQVEKKVNSKGSLLKEKSKKVIEPEKLIEVEPIQEVENEMAGTMEEAVKPDEAIDLQPARYVYGVANKGVSENLGAIGLEGANVYTIPYKDMCIIVHNCPKEPYQSDDESMVKEWLFTQQEVLDVVGEKFGVVLPMSFDMIIEGKNGSDPEEAVKVWLEGNYDDFKMKMAKLINRQEFGVQVILDTEELSEKLINTDEVLKAKKKDIDSKPEGIAYLERELLKDLVKEKLEEKADQYFKEFYSIIKNCTVDIVIGKTKTVGGNKQMIMNLSCLVDKDSVKELGVELEKIENRDGITVRFSGPWAPFSFVTPEKG